MHKQFSRFTTETFMITVATYFLVLRRHPTPYILHLTSYILHLTSWCSAADGTRGPRCFTACSPMAPTPMAPPLAADGARIPPVPERVEPTC